VGSLGLGFPLVGWPGLWFSLVGLASLVVVDHQAMRSFINTLFFLVL